MQNVTWNEQSCTEFLYLIKKLWGWINGICIVQKLTHTRTGVNFFKFLQERHNLFVAYLQTN
jgi:hypothetical protein